MLARRQEQENLVNEHQVAAASKPLNQDARGLAPKTPANNKPKAPLKNTVGGDENVRAAGPKQKENAFITPLAPRERKPLGAKTTNAKSKAFQTPALLTTAPDGGAQRTHRRSASARKSRLKVHQPDAVEADPIPQTVDDEDDVPEVEYCPPKITELPDLPDLPYAFAPDHTFPQFEGPNMLQGSMTMYCNPIGEDGLSESERRHQELRAELDVLVEQELQKCMEEFRADFDLPSPNPHHKPTNNSRTTSAPSHSRSRAAAAALSTKPQPSYAAPTAAARARGASSLSVRPNKAATLASKSTIGYSKGRKVSASLKHGADNQPGDTERPKKFWERFDQVVEAEEKMMDELLGPRPEEPEDEQEDEDEDEVVVPWKRDLDEVFQDNDEPFVFHFQRPDE